jgi:hypothetical protein
MWRRTGIEYVLSQSERGGKVRRLDPQQKSEAQIRDSSSPALPSPMSSPSKNDCLPHQRFASVGALLPYAGSKTCNHGES